MNTKRYLTIALVVSVILNLVLVGVLAGRASNVEVGMGRIDPAMGMRRLSSDLPDDRIEELRPLFRAYFMALRPRFRDIREAQAALRDAMLSDPLDREGMKAALVEINSTVFNAQSEAHDALITLTEALTLEERGKLVSLLQRRPPRRGERPGEGRRPPRPEGFDAPSGHEPASPSPPPA
jgi:uncharacterized membrane protein